jgi:hypothetical protein
MAQRGQIARPSRRDVANNHRWTQTDKRYIKKLLDFRLQGDDVLNRQISEKTDLTGR